MRDIPETEYPGEWVNIRGEVLFRIYTSVEDATEITVVDSSRGRKTDSSS